MNGRQNASSNSSSSSNHRQYPSSRHGNGGSHRSVRFGDDYQHSHGSDDYGPFQWLKDLATACLALLCIAGLSTILVVLYVTVRPFSLPLYRRLAAQLGGAPFLDAVALLLPNTRLYLTGDSDVPSPVGTSLMVSNHLVDGDWWAILMLARSVGLRGSVKVFLRNEYLQINMDSSKGAVPTSEALICNRTSTGPAHNGYQNSSLHFQTPLHSQLPHASHHHPQDLSLLAKLLHLFLEFPLINGEDYMSNRNQLFQLLRSFAETTGTTPLQLLFFPEGWSQHNGADRSSILDKSNEFARREGRPQLKHLLLPRTRGFNASLECLRESSPIVYDVTMAYSGYDGSLPPSVKLCVFTLWNILRRKFPKEIHIQIKRYSMEEVFQDSSWLDKKWAEKDRLLSHFVRHQAFPNDSRGFCRHRVFDSRTQSLESSLGSLLKLMMVPCAVPLLLLLSIPLFWFLLWSWLAFRAFRVIFPDPYLRSSDGGTDSRPGSVGGAGQTPGSNSAGTPFFPATPFASPSITSWRDMFSHKDGGG